tara:strand:- start:226 stop:672 length:447 start_codon:yes stop_codon:yes gene_type:complete
MLGWQLVTLGVLHALSVAGAVVLPPSVVVVVADASSCAEIGTGFEVNLVLGAQVYVPTSTLPVWEALEVGPARAIVQACQSVPDPVCRRVVLTPIAERCTVVAPLGVSILGTKPLRLTSSSVNVYATVAMVALVAVAYVSHVTGTTSQ